MSTTTNEDEEVSSLQMCISNCQSCHSVCLRTLDHCLALGGEHAGQPHIELLLDCAEICQTSANFMLRGSPRHGLTCRACAEVCDACADHCESMGGDEDLSMQACARTCRECAATCWEMARMMGTAEDEEESA